MRTMTTILILTLLMSSAALADKVTCDFESGINIGGWHFGGPADAINTTGGNPDSWYSTSFLFIFAPIFYSDYEAEYFTGNYAQAGVSRISGDFQTTYCENGGAGSFPITVLLRNCMGTPEDVTDDVYVYPEPVNYIPWIGEGWKHYDFDIPSDFNGAAGELPTGWRGGSYYTGGAVFPSDVTFHDIISNVQQVEFWFMDPDWMALMVPWDVGADNITIEYDTVPVADEASSWGDVKNMFR